jgi:hypothetical protein
MKHADLISRSRKMSSRRLLQQAFGLTLGVLLLAGCGGAPAEPTSTSTPIPPASTPTPSATDTPTPIPTPTAIPASETPFTVGGFQLQITSVSLGTAMFAPAGMAEDETVLTVEVKVLSGDPEIVAQTDGEFDVWTTDNSGRRNSSRAATATTTGDGTIHAIQWLFGVAKSSESLYLHFPGGVTVDLSPLLP